MHGRVSVKDSPISGKGVFAERNFSAGEVVLRWRPKSLTDEQLEDLSKQDRQYAIMIDGKWYLMQEPERYINHSCDANTKVVGTSDVATRNIKTGEEITSDYSQIKAKDAFVCNCNAPTCKHQISN